MTKTSDIPKKLGRKPIGSTNLTPAERQRRYREKLREKGSKDFLLTLTGLHLQHVETLSVAQGISPSSALKMLVEPALDRYVGVMNRVQRMSENGSSHEDCAKFIEGHLYPELPAIEDRKIL